MPASDGLARRVVDAVSYTHLDVYKRQVCSHPAYVAEVTGDMSAAAGDRENGPELFIGIIS